MKTIKLTQKVLNTNSRGNAISWNLYINETRVGSIKKGSEGYTKGGSRIINAYRVRWEVRWDINALELLGLKPEKFYLDTDYKPSLKMLKEKLIEIKQPKAEERMAQPIYAATYNKVETKVAELQRLLKEHKNAFIANGSNNWGYIGDMNRIEQQLSTILSSLNNL